MSYDPEDPNESPKGSFRLVPNKKRWIINFCLSRKKTFLANNSIFLAKPQNEKGGLTGRKSTATAAKTTTAEIVKVVFGFLVVVVAVGIGAVFVVAIVVIVVFIVVEEHPLTIDYSRFSNF